MPVSCVAYGCTNRYKPGQTIHFFRFPLANVDLNKKWIAAIKRKTFTPTKWSRLCSDHFVNEDYQINTKNVLLKKDAVPTVFSAFPSYYQKVSKVPRNEPFVRNPIQIEDSNFNAADISNSVENDIPSVVDKVETCNKITLVDDKVGTSDDITLVDDKVGTSGGITLVDDKVGTSDEIVLTTNNKEVQTVNTYTSELFLKKKIKTLQQKLRRKNIKIHNLQELLNDLKTKGLIDGEPVNIIENSFSGICTFNINKWLISYADLLGIILDLFKNELKNSKKSTGCRYTKEIKQFALTLHYYSPKAYNFCCTILTLPYPSSIANWISTVNVKPGFFEEVFKSIKLIPANEKDCNLVFDSMSIRKKIVYDGKEDRFLGYCDFGGIQVETQETPATESLFFMLVGLNGKWKWPIGYFLQAKSTAIIQAGLITTAIQMAKKAGARVWGVTCDGTTTNLSTMTHLGCKLSGSYEEICESFSIPGIDWKVYYVPDACHNLKLARNALATYQQFKYNDDVINWSYIRNLNTVQQNLGLNVANKVSNTHIDWKKNIMKVKLAAQTLSSSTADALEFFRHINESTFKNSEPTETFIRVIDRIFDFLNSRNSFGKGFKKPLYINDVDRMKSIIIPQIEYLLKLTNIEGKCLYLTARKTFILGFSVAVKSIFSIADELFYTTEYKYMLTYKFSQDHLEMFFSKIRQRFGNNNNPNALELRTALKQILLKNSISSSYAANCIALYNTGSESVFEIHWAKKTLVDNVIEEEENENLSNFLPYFDNFDLVRGNILYYICGFIVRSVYKKIDCQTCTNSIIENESEHSYSHKYPHSILVDVKNRGGLIKSSKNVG